MSEDALPCIVCRKELRNEMPGAENQPRDGVAATTHGNYGSRVWDSLDGTFLEFNVCDDCLTEAGDRGAISVARTKRPVSVEGILVGYEETEYLPLTWKAGGTDWGGSVLDLDLDEVDGLADRETLHIDQKKLELARLLLSQEG